MHNRPNRKSKKLFLKMRQKLFADLNFLSFLFSQSLENSDSCAEELSPDHYIYNDNGKGSRQRVCFFFGKNWTISPVTKKMRKGQVVWVEEEKNDFKFRIFPFFVCKGFLVIFFVLHKKYL